MLEAEGIPYEYQNLLEDDRAFAREQIAAGRTAFFASKTALPSVHRHEQIDRVTDTAPTDRKPNDVVSKQKFELIQQQVQLSAERVTGFVDKYIAHAAIPYSRNLYSISAVTLGQLWKAHEDLCRAASCLATHFLGVSFSQPLAYPCFDQFLYIDRPLVRCSGPQFLDHGDS
jgi:hypothetical protein